MRRACWAGPNTRERNFVCFRGAIDPVSRRRCTRRWTQARLTSYRAATLSASTPESHAFNTRLRRSIEYGAMAPPAGEVPQPPYYVQGENALVTAYERQLEDPGAARAGHNLAHVPDELADRRAVLPQRMRDEPIEPTSRGRLDHFRRQDCSDAL